MEREDVNRDGLDGPLQQVLGEVIQRRRGGEALSDQWVMEARPDLMPQLGEELRGLEGIRRAYAMSIGAAGDDAIIHPLSASRLEDPIALDGEEERGHGDTGGEDRRHGDTGTRGHGETRGGEAVMGLLSGRNPAGVSTRSTGIAGYQIIEEINSGGQASVYKAKQESTGRIVAIKVLYGGPFLSTRGRKRFERESTILAALHHPNIVRIIDRGRTADGSFYLVMDYIDGVPLDVAVAEGGLSLEDVLNLFIKIADGVQEAHDRGMVHRDLKPANIRVDRRGNPLVLDFGLAFPVEAGAESRSNMTQTGQVIGSLPWASPEQASGKVREMDARSDVYSLGVILYEALMGQPPYPVSSIITEMLKSIREIAPRPFRKVSNPRYPTVDRVLEAIVLKALAKEAGERYESAKALKEDLTCYRDGRPTVAQPVRRMHKGWVAMILGICLVCGGMSVLGAFDREVEQVIVDLPVDVNSIGMRMVQIPAGEFMMGSSPTEKGRTGSEGFQRVQISRPYYLGTTEVTVGQYRGVMGAVPDAAAADGLPVVGVTWEEAVEFCRRLGEREGRTYRLPTEAEWEYACRAGTQSAFADSKGLDGIGWHGGNSGGKLHPVGTKNGNPWGLNDMHGNAREWCADWSGQAIRGERRLVDPSGPADGFDRVHRGGSALSPWEECRSAARDQGKPYLRLADVGFRVVFEAHVPTAR